MLGSHDRRWIIGTLVGLVLMLFVFVVVLWRIGLLNLPETDPGAQAFTAVLALLGALFTAVITFLGVLLKLSSDARTFELKREADAHASQMDQEAQRRHCEAEDRLKMDTCIRAVGLMSTASGEEASAAQMAGVLFALFNLGQAEFALTLLERMWPNGELESPIAVWLVNEGLKHPERIIQFKAAAILNENSGLLKKPTGDFEWPLYISSQWRPNLYVYARNQIFDALHRCLLSNRPENWSREARGRFVVFFHRMMSTDEDPSITTGAALILSVLLKIHKEEIFHYWKDPVELKQPVGIQDVIDSVAKKEEEAKGHKHSAWYRYLQKWAEGGMG